VGGRRRAGAEVREDLVDHRRLRDARHDPHGTVAGRAREWVDFKLTMAGTDNDDLAPGTLNSVVKQAGLKSPGQE